MYTWKSSFLWKYRSFCFFWSTPKATKHVIWSYSTLLQVPVLLGQSCLGGSKLCKSGSPRASSSFKACRTCVVQVQLSWVCLLSTEGRYPPWKSFPWLVCMSCDRFRSQQKTGICEWHLNQFYVICKDFRICKISCKSECITINQNILHKIIIIKNQLFLAPFLFNP